MKKPNLIRWSFSSKPGPEERAPSASHGVMSYVRSEVSRQQRVYHFIRKEKSDFIIHLALLWYKHNFFFK